MSLPTTLSLQQSLPALPIDIWTEIGKYLNLEESFNLYREHFTEYDFGINDYFPLIRIQNRRLKKEYSVFQLRTWSLLTPHDLNWIRFFSVNASVTPKF